MSSVFSKIFSLHIFVCSIIYCKQDLLFVGLFVKKLFTQTYKFRDNTQVANFTCGYPFAFCYVKEIVCSIICCKQNLFVLFCIWIFHHKNIYSNTTFTQYNVATILSLAITLLKSIAYYL